MCEFKNVAVEEVLNDFRKVCEDYLYYADIIPTIERIDEKEWPLQFYRDYVSKSQPVVIKGGCERFAATTKWSPDYFLRNYGSKRLRVDVTPNGYADAVTIVRNASGKEEKMFLMAEEKQMEMGEFLQALKEPKENYVCYIQSQNSNLTESLNEFMNDVEPDIIWASKAFNKQPDAVNFWMGDHRAVTSTHKDPYENIYCVIDGFKDFILIPPTDFAYLPYKEFQCANYTNVSSSSFEIHRQESELCVGNNRTISWIDIDPLKPDLLQHPEFSKAHLYNVRVNKGDCLYLPALWFHHVQQSHAAIAVNYWYDMDFDVKYCYNSLLQDFSKKLLNRNS